MATCSNCGREVTGAFCSGCGTPAPTDPGSESAAPAVPGPTGGAGDGDGATGWNTPTRRRGVRWWVVIAMLLVTAVLIAVPIIFVSNRDDVLPTAPGEVPYTPAEVGTSTEPPTVHATQDPSGAATTSEVPEAPPANQPVDLDHPLLWGYEENLRNVRGASWLVVDLDDDIAWLNSATSATWDETLVVALGASRCNNLWVVGEVEDWEKERDEKKWAETIAPVLGISVDDAQIAIDAGIGYKYSTLCE